MLDKREKAVFGCMMCLDRSWSGVSLAGFWLVFLFLVSFQPRPSAAPSRLVSKDRNAKSVALS